MSGIAEFGGDYVVKTAGSEVYVDLSRVCEHILLIQCCASTRSLDKKVNMRFSASTL